MTDNQASAGRNAEAPAPQAGDKGFRTAAPGRSQLPGQSPHSAGLLVQIPDIGAPAPGIEADSVADGHDGRMLSSGMSAKILLGGGLFLLLVAVMPVLFGTRDDPNQPATGSGPSAVQEGSGSLTLAPKWDGKAAQTLKEAVEAARGEPQIGLESEQTQTPPSPGDPRSIAPPEPSIPAPVLAETSPIPAHYPNTQDISPYYNPGTAASSEPNRPMAIRQGPRPPVGYDHGNWTQDYQVANHAAAIAEDRSGDPRAYPPGDRRDYRNDPNARQPGYPVTRQSQYPVARQPGYPVTQQSQYPVTQQSQYPVTQQSQYPVTRQSQYPVARQPEYPNTRQPAVPIAAGAYPGASRAGTYPETPAARVADSRQAVRPQYPTTSSSAVEEPGVARFKGTIEKPTVRTGHDDGRSSIY